MSYGNDPLELSHLDGRHTFSHAATSARDVLRRSARNLASIILSVVALAGTASAQTVVSTTSPATYGETSDASGVVYYISRNSTFTVLKATPSTSGYTETVAFTVTNPVSGNIVLDAAGNFYFISNGALVKETVGTGGTYTETVLAASANLTTGLAIDSSGNLYGTTNNAITKFTKNGSAYPASQAVTGLSSPYSVAVDSHGSLFVSVPNLDHSVLLKETLSGSSYTETTLQSGLIAAAGVAVDNADNVYFTDLNHIYKSVPNSGGYATSMFGVFDGSSGTAPQPKWVSISPNGKTLFLEGSINGQAPLLAFNTSSIAVSGIDFGTVAVASNATQTLTYTFASAMTLGSYKIVAQGTDSADFSDTGSGNCTAGSYVANATCTINITFAPKVTGGRAAAINFVDNTGKVFDIASLTGYATAPQIAFFPAQVSSLVKNTTAFSGIAVDDAGTVYLADLANKQILKETKSGSGTYTESTVATGLLGPHGVAVDVAGNLFVADYDRNAGSYGEGVVLKFTPKADGIYTQTTIATGLSYVGSVAADTHGNVFANDYNGTEQSVYRIALLPNGNYTTTVVINNARYGGMAVDSNDVIYISENQNGASRFAPDALGTYSLAENFGAGSLLTSGPIAVDPAGNIYLGGIGSGGSSQIVRVTRNSDGTYSQSYTAGSGTSAFAVDSSGNVYGTVGTFSAQSGGNVSGVYRADQVTPPTLYYPATQVGQTYAYPNSVQFVNIGNVPLTLVAPTSGSNPTISANFAINANYQSDGCPSATPGSPATIAPGIECRAFIDFKPTVNGTITGTYTMTDDNLNVANAKQVVPLTGTGTGGSAQAATLTWPTPAPIVSGTALSAVQLNATANVPGTFVYTPPAGTVLSPGTHTLSVAFTPTDTTNYNATTATVQILVTSSTTVTITWATPAPIVYGTALSTTQLNATANVAGTFTYTPAAGTVLNAGTQTLTANFTPTDTTTYSAATATVQLVVTKLNPNLTWNSPQPITYGTALSATQLNATASVPGVFVYTPAAGAVLPTGEQTLSVAFTPTDAVNYTTASTSVTITVISTDLDFTFTSTGNTYQTVIPGSSTNFSFALAPTNTTYPGAVTFSVSGLPAGATYTITPSTVTQSAGAQSETLTVKTASLVAQSDAAAAGSGHAPIYLSLALIPLCLVPRRFRRKLPGTRGLVLMLVGIATLAGCVVLSGCGSNNGFFGQAPKDYTITVTASSGSIEHSASVTLNLQ